MPEIKITATTAREFRKVAAIRRSVRQFTEEKIPEVVLQECLDMALLAPNSSNLQMWNFYRVSTPEKRKRLEAACLNQKAAKTASDLIVCTGNTRNWRQHSKDVLKHWPAEKIPTVVRQYYGGLTSFMYGTVPLDFLGLARAPRRRCATPSAWYSR